MSLYLGQEDQEELSYPGAYPSSYGTLTPVTNEDVLSTALVRGSYVFEGALRMYVSGALVATTVNGILMTDGNVRVDRFNANRRTLSIGLRGVAGDPVSDHLKNYGSLLGMEIEASQIIDGREFRLGVFIPDEVDHSQDGVGYTISLTAGDRSTLVATNRRTTRYIIPEGTPYNQAFQTYMIERYPDVELAMEPIEGITPQVIFGMDEDPWQGAIRLAESFGCETYFDRFGRCVLGVVADPYLDTIVAEYSDSDESKYPFVSQPLTRSINTREIYNGVIIQAGAPWLLFPICGHKWNTDPTSETYYDPGDPAASPVGPHPKVIRDSTVGTTSAATALAAAKYNEIVGMSEPISFIGMSNPILDVGQVVHLEAGDITLDGRMAVDELSFSLTSKGGMSVNGRRIA